MRSRSGFNSGRIAASQRPPIQINFSVGLLNSLIDHFTYGHEMLFRLEDQHQPSRPPFPQMERFF